MENFLSGILLPQINYHQYCYISCELWYAFLNKRGKILLPVAVMVIFDPSTMRRSSHINIAQTIWCVMVVTLAVDDLLIRGK